MRFSATSYWMEGYLMGRGAVDLVADHIESDDLRYVSRRVAVGLHLQRASPIEALDIGSLIEWTRSRKRSYPYDTADEEPDDSPTPDALILRGFSRAARRWPFRSNASADFLGFRLAFTKLEKRTRSAG